MTTAAAFEEVACLAPIGDGVEFDPAGYLAANPDVRRAGVDARAHFLVKGHAEHREQAVNRTAIARLRQAKLARCRFRRPPLRIEQSGAQNYLSPELIAEFGIPDDPPVSGLPYWDSLIAEFRANPDKLYLDLGAGLRRTYYSNVVNAEIYDNASADVVCVGEDLPFADASLDGVFAFAVLEHTLRPWSVAAEICRVLRPGGKVIIDWPFLQPVHGFPHHYYNATPEGNRRMFADAIDIEHLVVSGGQQPIHALWWLLHNWVVGLGPAEAQQFSALTVGELLASRPEEHALQGYCAMLPHATQMLIPAGSTLIGTRKAPPPTQG
jgi:SAM-dependent methyltransferase